MISITDMSTAALLAPLRKNLHHGEALCPGHSHPERDCRVWRSLNNCACRTYQYPARPIRSRATYRSAGSSPLRPGRKSPRSVVPNDPQRPCNPEGVWPVEMQLGRRVCCDWVRCFLDVNRCVEQQVEKVEGFDAQPCPPLPTRSLVASAVDHTRARQGGV